MTVYFVYVIASTSEGICAAARSNLKCCTRFHEMGLPCPSRLPAQALSMTVYGYSAGASPSMRKGSKMQAECFDL